MQPTNRLKICHLGMKRMPSREGGIEIVVEELSVRMAALGHQVTCYNRNGHHVCGKSFDSGRLKEYKGVQLKYVPSIPFRGLSAVSSSIFATVCAAFGKYDVVHVHAEGPALLCWLPKLFGKRVVVTIHGLDWQRAKWGRFARSYILRGEKNAARYADEIIVLSRGIQKYFKDKYGRDATYIPNGVNRPKKRNADLITKQFGLEKDSYVLFLGRLVPEKGIKYLLKAFGGVKTDKHLVIAGGTSDTDGFVQELRELAKDDGRIVFTGFVQGQVLEELCSNSFLYILPSDIEGMPLSLLEAMSYGNCCLVSDIPECTEVIEDKGLIFSKGDIRDLKEKMQDMCSHPELVEAYRQTAADFICKKYHWDDITEKTVRLYREAFYTFDESRRGSRCQES